MLRNLDSRHGQDNEQLLSPRGHIYRPTFGPLLPTDVEFVGNNRNYGRSSMERKRLAAVICGSFSRHLTEVQQAVLDCRAKRVLVLSPEEPWIADVEEGFLFVQSDICRVIHHVQDRHLQAIRRADFVWLCCADGYVGVSATLEIGYALACGTPIYSTTSPRDTTLSKFTRIVPSLQHLIKALKANHPIQLALSLPIDYNEAIHEANVLTEAFAKVYNNKNKVERESLLSHDLRIAAALKIAPELELRLD